MKQDVQRPWGRRVLECLKNNTEPNVGLWSEVERKNRGDKIGMKRNVECIQGGATGSRVRR